MAIDNRDLWPDLVGAARHEGGADDLLSLDDLHVSVHNGAATAVRGVSLRVRPGEIVGLVGESGSGKTLTCRATLGVLPPGCAVERGTVSFGGADVTSLSRRDWERLHGSHMGAVFQDPASYLNPVLTVGGQLAEVLRVKLRLGRRAAHRRALELFEAVGLRQPERVFHQIPAEPTTALDVTIQAEVLELLRRLRDERGLAVLFVSHDLAVITQLCDRIVVFYGGEIVESGPAEEITRRPRHPYTQALLRVASVGDFSRRELDVIAGQPPRVGEDITGCRFAARCPVAVPECGAGPVRSVPVGERHEARCVLAARAVVAS
jgi:peptide/nickel transport system ATP-binding protein